MSIPNSQYAPIVKFWYFEVKSTLPFPTVLFEQKSQFTFKWWETDIISIYINSLGFFCMGDLSILSNEFNE